MEYEEKLIAINGIGKGIAKKIISYAQTEEILGNKLHYNYDEMIVKFRDDVVKKLNEKFATTDIEKKPMEVVKDDQPKKTEVHQSHVKQCIDEKNLSRFYRISPTKIQFDCPNCQTHIQIIDGMPCPKCKYITELL